jgi:hypothetical protein
LDQPVSEAEPAGSIGRLGQDRSADRGFEQVEQGVLIDVGDLGQDVDRELPADNGRDCQHAHSFVAEALDTPRYHIADTRRQPDLRD